jgi:hypothetical protein
MAAEIRQWLQIQEWENPSENHRKVIQKSIWSFTSILSGKKLHMSEDFFSVRLNLIFARHPT